VRTDPDGPRRDNDDEPARHRLAVAVLSVSHTGTFLSGVGTSAQSALSVAAQVADTTEDDGFDDWGLLGLLGPLGLRKRTEHDVRTVDRTATTRQ